jgi:hypothetical protein
MFGSTRHYTTTRNQFDELEDAVASPQHKRQLGKDSADFLNFKGLENCFCTYRPVHEGWTLPCHASHGVLIVEIQGICLTIAVAIAMPVSNIKAPR